MCNFQIPEVTGHECSNKKTTKGKTTIFTNILTEIYCERDHWKYERPFVNKEFHMINDLGENCTSRMRLLADDILTCSTIESYNDAAKLQSDLTALKE